VEWEALASKPFFLRAVSAGKIVGTERLPPGELPAGLAAEGWSAVLRHETIPYVSYPYEWSFGMLRDAALCYLDLLAAALDEEMLLKDGTAYNLQWIGARPVFIDIPSFRRLQPGEPWPGYRQFCQTFLYPLFLQAYKNVPFQPWLRGSLDGIEASECNRLMSFWDLLRRPGVLTHVSLHAQMQTRFSQSERSPLTDLPEAGFNKGLIQANVRRLTQLIRQLRWRARDSTWSNYALQNSYSEADRERKESFVRTAVAQQPRRLVWDLGANTGTYSRIAAEHAEYVVALDRDPLAVERFYQSLQAEGNRKILPLYNNLADPSPNLGWRGLERKGLAERGRPDLTLCLALVHHLVLGANLPMAEFIGWLENLRTSLVIEFVTKADPMVKALLRNRPDCDADYEPHVFEHVLENAFRVERREALQSGTRILYYATPKS
jgi:hypothetical protein